MKTIITIFLLSVPLCFWGQSFYYVTAPNGLNVRKSPNLSSIKKAQLPFGMEVEKIANTDAELTLQDNGKTVEGKWVKIKYDNYTYLVSNKKEQFEAEGYVFDAYLKPLNNKDLISIKQIDQSDYLQLHEKAYKEIRIPRKIGTLDAVKTALKHRVEWVTEFEDSLYARDDVIKSIVLSNGKKLFINDKSSDVGFAQGWSGYFPEFDILLLEGGHSSDISFHLKTGETTQTAGNPEYIIHSPNKQYRLNGYHGGQECVSYFFQVKKNGMYQYFTQFNWDYNICTFKDFYWINNLEFIYTLKNYSTDAENGIVEYYKGELKNNQ